MGTPGVLRARYCIDRLKLVTGETHVVCMYIPVPTSVLVSWREGTGSVRQCCSCFWECCVFKWMLVGHGGVFSVCIDLCGWPCIYIYAYIQIYIYISKTYWGAPIWKICSVLPLAGPGDMELQQLLTYCNIGFNNF